MFLKRQQVQEKRVHWVTLVAAVSLALCAGRIDAATIDVFSTGVDSDGGVDQKWELISPGGPIDAILGDPIPRVWVDNDLPNYNWIGPTADPGASGHLDPVGDYEYTTNFTLGPFTTASLVVDYAADNEAEIFLNDQSFGVHPGSASGQAYSLFDTVDLTAALLEGSNTLRVEVLNRDDSDTFNPTGMVLQVTENSFTPIPIPPALLLFGSALVGLPIISRRRHAINR